MVDSQGQTNVYEDRGVEGMSNDGLNEGSIVGVRVEGMSNEDR